MGSISKKIDPWNKKSMLMNKYNFTVNLFIEQKWKPTLIIIVGNVN